MKEGDKREEKDIMIRGEKEEQYAMHSTLINGQFSPESNEEMLSYPY